MTFRNIVNGVLFLSVALSVHCAKDPDIVVTSAASIATVWGYVSPAKPAVRVFFVRGHDTIATVTADTVSGSYTLRNVPYDVYAIYGSSGNAYGHDLEAVDQPVYSVRTMYLLPAGTMVEDLKYADGDTLHPDTGFGDSLADFSYELSDTVSFSARPFAIVPASLEGAALWHTSGRYLYVDIPTLNLFSNSQVTLTCYVTAGASSGIPRDDSAVFRYALDTTGLGRATSRMLLLGYSPSGTSVFREDSLTVQFARVMNRDSVEKSVSVLPAVAKTFSWNNNTLIIAPANALEPFTPYTVTIGSGAMTLDSIHFGAPYVFSFTTGDRDLFSSTWPSDSAVDIPLNVPFMFNSPYSIEPQLIQNAFSITPPVDSLNFQMDKAGLVTVTHATLIADTVYRIVIDKSCQSLKGIQLGTDLDIFFHTVAAP